MSRISTNVWVLIGAFIGVLTGVYGSPFLGGSAELVSELFIRLLKLVSLPLIFLSVVTAISGMESLDELTYLGRKVLRYTLLTTLIAASVALALFVLIEPVSYGFGGEAAPAMETGGYWGYLVGIVPTNVIQPFYENHVLGVLFLAVGLALSILSLPSEHRDPLHQLFSSLFAAVMQGTAFLLKLMPFAVWSFVTLFTRDLMGGGLPISGIALYLLCVLLANVIQAGIVLPGLLLWKKRSPIQLLKAMWPALTVAFFSKSSGVALPMAMKCAEETGGISKRVSRFSFPLCVTINMNACAAFILITVLFVSTSEGAVYTWLELISWIFIATLAAIGNAGVPMGCYFLATAFLAAMNVPLKTMGAILPMYAIIDMLETAINVWSNGCVAAAVQADTENAEQPQESDCVPSSTQLGAH